MKAPGHYDAGPPVKTRFTTFAAEGFEIDACLEAEDRRLVRGRGLASPHQADYCGTDRRTAPKAYAPAARRRRASAWFEDAIQALKSASF